MKNAGQMAGVPILGRRSRRDGLAALGGLLERPAGDYFRAVMLANQLAAGLPNAVRTVGVSR